MTEVLVGLGIVALIIGPGPILERRSWNKGRCTLCGGPWEHFDTDSQGGRGYCCRNHAQTQYGPWISWPVDWEAPDE